MVTGSGYADTITGSTGTDTIHGGSGGDTIKGGSGQDSVYGGLGNDFLVVAGADAVAGETYDGGGEQRHAGHQRQRQLHRFGDPVDREAGARIECDLHLGPAWRRVCRRRSG